MTPQRLRKVSVGQKPRKHDFPKLKEKNVFFGKIEICQGDSLAKPFKGGSGGAYAPPGYFRGVWGGNAPPVFGWSHGQAQTLSNWRENLSTQNKRDAAT